MFDRVLLMAEGRTAYLGPAPDALSYFSSQGLPCPPNFNPADFYIHTLATVPGREAESRRKSKDLCDAFDISEAGRQIQELVKTNRSAKDGGSQDFDAVVEKRRSPYKASWFQQVRAVFWRSCLSIAREPAIVRIKLFQTIVSINIL